MNISSKNFTVRLVNEFESTMPTNVNNSSLYVINVSTANNLTYYINNSLLYRFYWTGMLSEPYTNFT